MSSFVAQPDLAFLARQILRIALSQTNCHAIATIQSVDYSKRSATARIVYTQLVNGSPETYPVLVDCPILVLQGGGGQLTFPISANNTCLALFNDVNMSRYISSGNQGAQPNDARQHAFSDAFLLVGLDSFPGAQAKSYFADGIELALYDEDGDVESSLQLTDTIKLFNASTDLKSVLGSTSGGLENALATFATSLGSASTIGQIAAAGTALATALATYLANLESLLT
jgi:hypothetical protein